MNANNYNYTLCKMHCILIEGSYFATVVHVVKTITVGMRVGYISVKPIIFQGKVSA